MSQLRKLMLFIQLGFGFGHSIVLGEIKTYQKVDQEADLKKQIDSIYKTLYYEDFQGALQSLRQVRKQAANQKLWEIQLSALLNMHYCAQYHGKLDTMVHYLKEARGFFANLPEEVPRNISDQLERKLRYADGNAAYRFGEYEQAIDEFEKIIAFDSLKPVYLYKCLSFIGHSYANLDYYPHAIVYHNQALDQLPAKKKYHYYRGVSYSYLGISYKKMYELQQDTAILRDALQHYLKSLAYFSQSDNKNKTGPIGCYTLLSEAYGFLGKYDSSFYFLQKARNTDPEHIETQRFWGMYYNRTGDYESARQHFLKSNDMIAQKQGERHFLIGRNLVQVGRQYEAEQRWQQALANYQQAFAFLTTQQDTLSDVFQNPDPQYAVSDRDFFECLRLKAGALLSWSRVASISLQDRQSRLKNSIGTYQSVVEMLDEQRTKYVSSRYRQLIGAKALSVYEKAISACYDAIQIGLDSAKYTNLAFHFMEKNKNRQLRDALHMKRNITYAGIPQNFHDEEQDLKRNLRYHSRLLIQEKQKLGARRDSEKLQALQEKVFTLNRQWEQFDRKMSTDYPAYYQLKNGEPIVNLDELQAKLERQTLLLEYFNGDEETFVFAISDKDIVFEKLLAAKALNHLVVKCLKSARKPSTGQLPAESAMSDLNTLFDGLFPDQLNISSETNKLVIVPDGPLGYLPFEMLVTSKAEQARFLLEDFDIRYVYSTYLYGHKSKQKKTDLAYLGFAPSYDPSSFESSEADLGNFGVLSHNEQEVREAKDYFSGMAFVGEASTEENFKEHGKSAGILHFSMHAMLDDERPELSRLIFHQSGNQAANAEIDGNLYLYELYNESLQAQLTVLSACNTGDGLLRRGEGITSLGRAFRFAGCNSIVMSLWEANDKHTSYLTSRFFFHLKEGKSKDAALRQAKLDFLNEPGHKYFKHPFNWASLVLIGEPTKLTVATDHTLLFSISIFAIIILGLLFYGWQKKWKNKVSL